MKNEIKFYAVTTMCGHVGAGKYLEVTFPIKASSPIKASNKARWTPRVKHNNKGAIISVKEVSYDKYCELLEENNNNLFLQCKNKQEQALYCSDIKLNTKKLFDEESDNSKHLENYLYSKKMNKIYQKDTKRCYEELNEFEYLF